MIGARTCSNAVAAAIVLALVPQAFGEEGDRGDVHASTRVYAQPAPSDWLLVLTPTVTGKAAVRPWLRFEASWTADVVTGATPRTYGRPDVVTAATPFFELRNVLGAGAEVRAGPATITAGYAYGTEHDYRAHLIRAGLKLDLFNHNTTIAASYSHSFDSVCDLDQAALPVTLRQPLDTSTGCFGGAATLTEESLDIDAAELSIAQTLSPRWVGTLIGSYQHLNGFQSNPYRRVRLNNGIQQAQESHPRVRDRGAVTARLRYAVAPLRASLGLDLRLYRDTWGVQSLTAEASWEQPFHRARPAWRFAVRARGYVQSSAFFYRDAGTPDSYENKGPVGLYFTADQELAPIADLLLGARFTHTSSRPPEHRIWRMFTALETAIALDWVKIFALSPDPPNVERTQGWASALVLGLSATGGF